tara:strand:+ start:43 stop:1413 length:1371 start_codon:yes stop_codon:yes gene_type:complete
MAESLPFKINIETEAGKLTSYASGGFATTEEAGISGSTILSRINSMPSISYSENDAIGSAHAGGNTFSHANNLWISASYLGHSGPADTGSITFHHTDTLDTADRLKRYRFFGDKVCNVLGLPARHWIYPVNFQLSDSSDVPNYFSGTVSADTLNVANDFNMSATAKCRSNIRLDATSGSNEVFFAVATGSGAFQTDKILMGYHPEDDKYVVRGNGAYIDGFSEVEGTQLKSRRWISEGDSDTMIEMHSKDLIFSSDGQDVFIINYQNQTTKQITIGDGGIDGVQRGQKVDFIVHASGSSNGMLYLLNCKGEEDEGFVGIREQSPSYPLEVSQHTSNISIYAEYDVAAYSDIRVKTDIETITEPLDKVLKLRGVTFRRTDTNADDRVMMGLIAQETEPIVPEVVVTNENPKSDKRYGHKSISYGNLAGLLIEAIKEQQGQIEELKTEIEELKNGSSK